MTKYLDIMPAFSAFLEDNPEFAAYTKAASGEIYSINRVRDTMISRAMTFMYASNENLEKYGISMDELKTTDGFYNALKKIKTADSAKIPLSLTFDKESGQRVEWLLKAAFGIYNVSAYNMDGVDENGKVFLYDTSDNYKAYLKYMNKLFTEGLLDNDAFIMTTAEFQAKVRSGESVFFGDWAQLQAAINAKDASCYLDYATIVGMKSDLVDKIAYLYFPQYTAGARLFINADTEYPEAICRLVDYCFADEGVDFFNYGVENVSFKYVDDGLGNKMPSTEDFWDQKNYKSASEWLNQKVVITQAFQMLVTSAANRLVDKASDEQLNKWINEDENYRYTGSAAQELAIRKQTEEEVVSMPSLAYTTDESKERASLNTDIGNYLQTMKSDFIRGKQDIDATWDSYVAKVNEMGLDQLLKIEQAAYDRYAANLK